MQGGFGTSPIELMATDAMLRGEIFIQDFNYNATWLTGTASALGANASVDQQIQINQDSDFVVQMPSIVALTAAGTFLATPDYLIQIVNSGSGRQLMSSQTHVAAILGSLQATVFPSSLPCPFLISANSTLTLSLTNRTGTAANFVQVVLIGFKVFYTGGNRQQIFHTL